MSTPKLAIGLGLLFCSFVAVLMIILYYPKDTIEEEFDTPKRFTPNQRNDFNSIADEEPKYSTKDFAKTLEDFGAAFLAFLAIGLIVSGLVSLFCACCCLVG